MPRRLERNLLAAGEWIVRVLMAATRTFIRSAGKSDPIDALAVARVALREPDLPQAQLDEPTRELKLLLDHREDLVAERTRVQTGSAGTSTSHASRARPILGGPRLMASRQDHVQNTCVQELYV